MVISFRGTTSNIDDLKTDTHLLASTESTSIRFIESELLCEKVIEKYPNIRIVSTGSSMGGSIAFHIAQEFNMESHSFNPGISFNQTFNENYDLTESQTIYRTHFDPVFVNAEIIYGMNQRNRIVKHVYNSKTEHSHSLKTFYDDDAERDINGNYIIKRQSISETETEQVHSRIFTKLIGAYNDSHNLDNYMNKLNTAPNVFVKVATALP